MLNKIPDEIAADSEIILDCRFRSDDAERGV